MKVLVQWSEASPRDWQEVDSSAWTSLPSKPIPRGGEILDGPGWIAALNVQSVEFTGYDHYALEELNDGSGGIRVTVWNDDPDDQDLAKVRLIRPDQEPFQLGFYGQVYTFHPLAPDPAFGGAYNTRQTVVWYAEQDKAVWDHLGDVPKRPWGDFFPPDPAVTRHGIWLTPKQMRDHVESLSLRGWREWTEGLPTEEIVARELRDQRSAGRWDKPKGTKTVFWRDTNLAVGWATCNHEDEFSETAGGAGVNEQSANLSPGAAAILTHAATSPTNFPNDADWPNGNYRCQLDCTAAGSNVTYGLNLVSPDGFNRLNAAASSSLQNWIGSPAFTGTGLKLATATSDPTAGDATERFGVGVGARNTATMNANQTFTLRVNTSDSFADGPWTAAVTVTPGTLAMTLATFAATVLTPRLVVPGLLALALTTFAPSVTVSDNQTVTPSTVALSTSSFAPTVSVTNNQLVTPGTASLITTAFAPTVSATDHQTVTPGTAALTTTTFAPTVTATANQLVTPSTTALTTATFAPTVTASSGLTVVPGTAALTLTTFAPTVLTPRLVTPGVEALTLATFEPVVSVSEEGYAKTVITRSRALIIGV